MKDNVLHYRQSIHIGEPIVEDFSNDVVVIDGAEAYELLCPVSSVTGCRENPLALLKSLVNDPSKSRALDSIFMELPSIPAPDSRLSPDDLFGQLRAAFEGTAFYDDDKFAERLMNISQDLLKTVGVDGPISKVEKPDSVDSSDVSSSVE